MPGFYDYDPGPSREDFEKAADDIARQRREDPRGWAGYDYIPAPTAAEIWERMEQNRHPYPDRG
jgi:hypothetical protein